MIFPDQAVRIVIATKPVDFRKGHDGLAPMAQAELGFAPKPGVMVVIRPKRGDRGKVLLWDDSGIVLIYKRESTGSRTEHHSPPTASYVADAAWGCAPPDRHG